MIRLTYSDNDYILECWGASTKHPDSIDRYSDWNNKSEFIDTKYQIYQWLCWIASNKNFPFHAFQIIDYANKHWRNW